MNKLQLEYSWKRILLIQKSKLFFWIHVFPPILGMLLLTILLFFLKAIIKDNFNIYITWIIIIITLIIFGKQIIKSYIDYKMDFVIITPNKIILYEQNWLFDRSQKSISEDKINSLLVNKKSFLNSFFNNWTISILAEWWSADWEIHITYVNNPESTRVHIENIINQNTK